MARWPARRAFVLALGLAASAAAAPPDAPSAAPPDAPGEAPGEAPPASIPPAPATGDARPPPWLKLDVDKTVAVVLARAGRDGMLRFEETIEVRDRQRDALESHLRGTDLECGASAAGPPTRYEMNPYRGATIPLHVDFLGPANLLRRRLKGSPSSKKEPRYFLYAVRRKAEPGPLPPVGEGVAFVVREGPVPEDVRASVPGTTWELIAGFADRAEATEAFLRLRRGFGSPTRTRPDDRLPPWVAANCRPSGAR